MRAAFLLPILLLCSCGELRPLNGNAATPIYQTSTAYLGHLTGHDTVSTTEVDGLFRVNRDGTRAIYITGVITPTAWYLLHEATHYYEDALRGDPEGQRRIRHAFRQLNSPTFEIGNADLLKELP